MGNLNRSLIIIFVTFSFIFCIIGLYIQYNQIGETITYVIDQEIQLIELIYFGILLLIIPIIIMIYGSLIKQGTKMQYQILFFRNSPYNISSRTGIISVFIILITILIMIIYTFF